VSTNTSVAAIKDPVNVAVLGFAFGTGFGAPSDAEEQIAGQVGGRRGIQRFEAGGRFAAMREDETLAPGNTAQNSLRIPPKLQHGYGFHNVNFKFKWKY
jgi:hypothetical protein